MSLNQSTIDCYHPSNYEHYLVLFYSKFSVQTFSLTGTFPLKYRSLVEIQYLTLLIQLWLTAVSLWGTWLSTVCASQLRLSFFSWCFLCSVCSAARTRALTSRMGEQFAIVPDVRAICRAMNMNYRISSNVWNDNQSCHVTFVCRFWCIKWLLVIGLVVAFFFIPDGANYTFSQG